MPRKCIVCEHEDVKKINKLLLEGKRNKYIGYMFDIPYYSIARHKKKHLMKMYAEDVSKSIDVKNNIKSNYSSNPVHRKITSSYEFILNESINMYTRCVSNDDHKHAVKYIEQARRAVDSTCRVLNLFDINNEEKSWKDIRGIMLKTLDKFPEAKLEVARVLANKKNKENI